MTNPRDLQKLVSKVNSSPRGLQDLLGNVNQGINPHELDHKISPTVDLYPFWSSNKILATQVNGDIAGTVGQYVAVPVPEGELWQVIAASAHYDTIAATDDTHISVGVLAQNLSQFVSFHDNVILNSPGAAGSHTVAGGSFGDRFVLSGGWNIAGLVNGSSVGTVREMSVVVLYVKLTE